MIRITYIVCFFLSLASGLYSQDIYSKRDTTSRTYYFDKQNLNLMNEPMILPATYRYHLHTLGAYESESTFRHYMKWSEIRYAGKIPDARISDYIIYSHMGKFKTQNEFKSLPILGAYTYIRFMRPFKINDRLTLSVGAFGAKSLIQKKVYHDFGLVGNLDLLLIPDVYLNIEHQQSFINNPDKPKLIRSMYPNTNSNINIMIMPKENVRFKIGVLRD